MKRKTLIDSSLRNPNTVFARYIDVPYYNDFLENPTRMVRKFNRKSKAVMMTPEQYYEECAKMFEISVDNLKSTRINDKGKDYLKQLEEVISDDENQFPMTYIDPTSRNQEGLHRMFALGELYGWNKVKFPVLVVSVADERQERINNSKKEKETIEGKINAAFHKAIKPKYLSRTEFANEFRNLINESIFGRWSSEEEPSLHIGFMTGTVVVDIKDFSFRYDETLVKYETKEEREKDEEEMMRQIESDIKNGKYGSDDDLFEE